MKRSVLCPALTFVIFVGAVGCSRFAELAGLNEPPIPPDATIERDIPTDGRWLTFASKEPLGSVRARSDVPRRWASPRYGTSGWLPAIVGENVSEGEMSEFGAAKWIWYPQEGFQFAGRNSMPENKKVVHFRREFYNDKLKEEIEDAYVIVMTSGSVSYRVFVNGMLVKLKGKEEYERVLNEPSGGNIPRTALGQRGQALVYGGVPDLAPRRYAIKEHLRVGKNVVAIEATTHIENEVDGETAVPNYVRSGLLARIVIRPKTAK